MNSSNFVGIHEELASLWDTIIDIAARPFPIFFTPMMPIIEELLIEDAPKI